MTSSKRVGVPQYASLRFRAMLSPGVQRSRVSGPDPAVWEPASAKPVGFMTMPAAPAMSNSQVTLGRLSTTFTVCASTASVLATTSMARFSLGATVPVRIRSMFATTASASTGDPSENLADGFSRKV